jgi:hypothetical protein
VTGGASDTSRAPILPAYQLCLCEAKFIAKYLKQAIRAISLYRRFLVLKNAFNKVKYQDKELAKDIHIRGGLRRRPGPVSAAEVQFRIIG